MSKQRWAAASAIVGLVSAWALLDLVSSDLGQDRRGRCRLHRQPVTFSINGPTQRLEMVVATSRILTLEYKIPRLLVNNPEIVRATPISPNQVQLSALHPGVTQLNVWDENKKLYTVDVVVTRRTAVQLQMLIKSEFPDADVRVRPLANSVYLSGYVPSPSMVRQHRPDRRGLLSQRGQQPDDRWRAADPAEDQGDGSLADQAASGRFRLGLPGRSGLRRSDGQWAGCAGGTAPGRSLATGGDTVRFGIVDGNRAVLRVHRRAAPERPDQGAGRTADGDRQWPAGQLQFGR